MKCKKEKGYLFAGGQEISFGFYRKGQRKKAA